MDSTPAARLRLTRQATLRAGAAAGAASLLGAGAPGQAAAQAAPGGPVEPRAGAWQTWVLTSGSQLRLGPPPDRAASQAEVTQLQALAAQRDAPAREQITYWNAGAPGYRWNGLLRDELLARGVVTASAVTSRQRSLVAVAIYDAVIAAWDSKYAYARPRPSELDGSLDTGLANPPSPSYPSDYAAVAGAASTVLAYLFPDRAEAFTARAAEAARSRLLAGVEYPSDSQAGLALGRQVGALVVERAQRDGSDAPWTGRVPDEPGRWSLAGYPEGTQPAAPTFGTLRPWVLAAGSQFRPGPPPAAESDQAAADLAQVTGFPRTFVTNAAGFYWQSPRAEWALLAEQKVFEYGWADNPPRAARVDALLNVTAFDAAVACWDAKYAYWALRPFQLDPAARPSSRPPTTPATRRRTAPSPAPRGRCWPTSSRPRRRPSTRARTRPGCRACGPASTSPATSPPGWRWGARSPRR